MRMTRAVGKVKAVRGEAMRIKGPDSTALKC